MPLKIRRKNGEITDFINSEYLPAYYFIPKEILDKCGKKLNSIPRNIRQVVSSWDAIETVESDLFAQCIIDAYACMVWPYMGLNAPREAYSGYEPSWRYAHCPSYWIDEMIHVNALPTVVDLYRTTPPDEEYGYTPLEIVDMIFKWLVPQVMRKNRMDEVIEVAEEYRCFEDFDTRHSNRKTDFFRKWYHTRTAHPIISLEAWQESYRENNDGAEWDIADDTSDAELEVTAPIMVEDFMSTLTDKDRRILELRMQGATLEEIAGQLGYSNHSGVLKRIRKIGQAYEKFAGVDYGFTEKKII